jgi:hypothetical protein
VKEGLEKLEEKEEDEEEEENEESEEGGETKVKKVPESDEICNGLLNFLELGKKELMNAVSKIKKDISSTYATKSEFEDLED